MNRLPPLHISLLKEIPDWEELTDVGPLQKIDYVVKNSFLTSNEDYASYEKFSEKAVGDYCMHGYVAKGKTENSIMQALCEDEYEVHERNHEEYLLFFFRTLSSSMKEKSNGNVFVLSTGRAFKTIHLHCSSEFSPYISKHLSKDLIKIDRLVTAQLLGTASDSVFLLQDRLPETVEQRNLVPREFTALLRSIPSIEGSEIKVKFKERGIVIYRDLLVAQYGTILREFEDKLKLFTNEIVPSESDIIPKGSMQKITDLHVIQGLNQVLSQIITLDKKLVGWNSCLRLSQRWYSNVVKFRMDCTDYGSHSKGGKHSFSVEFKNPHTPPSMESVRETLEKAYHVRWLLNKNYIQNVICRREITLNFRGADEFWYGHPLLDCIEGTLNNLKGEVYFRLGSDWYQVKEDYLQKVAAIFKKVIGKSILKKGEIGHLSFPWFKENNSRFIGEKEFKKFSKKMQIGSYRDFVKHHTSKGNIGKVTILKKDFLVATQPCQSNQQWFEIILNVFYSRIKLQKGEVEYNRFYVAPGANSGWFDGNSQLFHNVELFDILWTNHQQTFIYHVKKEFGNKIRDAASQLLISAQTIRNILNQGESFLPDSEFSRFCETMGGNQKENLLNAFRLKDSKNIHFVLAFPLGFLDPCIAMENSASLIARLEVIKLKKEIKELGFTFRISPIDEVFEHPISFIPYAKRKAYVMTEDLSKDFGVNSPFNENLAEKFHEFQRILWGLGFQDFTLLKGKIPLVTYISGNGNHVFYYDERQVWHCQPI